MARYDHLPIYKKALELVVFIEDAVRGFSRFHKYSIGERLRQTSWEAKGGAAKPPRPGAL